MDVISSICNCIKVLCGSQHAVLPAPSTIKTDAFIAHLKNNISLMLSALKAQSKLQELLKTYEHFVILDSEDNVPWNFITWCLILFRALHDSLSGKIVGGMEKKGAPLLSISQQKAIENCLQFIIALGILPNLLPGVGISLKNRTEYANIVKCVGTGVCPRTKYKRLVSSSAVLLTCTSNIVLQSIIITRHAGDLLAALFQLCYAPIKKLKENKQYSISKTSCTSKDELSHPCCCQATDRGCKKELCYLCKKFNDMLEEITDNLQWTEDQLICEMWDDRHNFMPHLEILLQKICPDVLIWELFLLQGTYCSSVKETQAKTPLWLRKICNQMLTEQLLKPQGLKLFIRTLLDKTADIDLKEDTVDKAKVDVVARLISFNPVQNISFEEYVKSISVQVIDLLHSREEKMKSIFTLVASSVMMQFAERNRPLSEKYLFRKVFKELCTCLDNAEISRHEEDDCLVQEDDLSVCIEILYKIFVQYGVPSQQNTFTLLLPFYHLLFIVFAQTQSGISFLCPQLKGLLVSLVKSFSVSDALILLRLASFEDVTFHPVQYATGIKCVLGDSGGIVLIKNSNLSPENLLDDINRKCSAVITILDEISNRKLKVSYFLCLLKRLTDVSVGKAILGEDFQETDFRNNLILLQQLQEIAETIGEDLVEDIFEAVNLVKVILEKAVVAQNSEHCQQLLFGSETVLMSLVILSTITEYKNQLSSLHWKIMKKCLPSLQKLATNSDNDILKSMCENLIFAIATHGAAASTKKAKELSSKQKTNSLSMFQSEKVLHTEKPTPFGILDTVPEETRHEVVKEGDLCEHRIEMLNCTTGDSMVQTTLNQNFPTDDNLDEMSTKDTFNPQKGESSTFKLSDDSVSNLPSGDKFCSETSYSASSYEAALTDLNDPVLPVRGHGLITLTRLINGKNAEALAHKEDLLKIFMENLSDEDSYIYLASIQGLCTLADVSIELVLPTVLKKFSDTNDERTEAQLKLGEVLLKICKNLGEMTVKYRSEFIHAYLCGAKHKMPEVRASSLSNLGEVCKWLKFSLGPFLQEILLCVLSLVKTDADMEVRRSAVLVITLLLRGTGKDALVVLETEMKELYHVLRHVHNYEKDDVLKLHAQLALEEINGIVTDFFGNRPVFTKEIRVLDPF